VNIDTDLRLASTGAIRQFLGKHPEEFDPRKYLKETIKEMKAVCVERYEAFGTAGQASKIKVIALEQMVERYESGKLAPQIQ
jgi:fructose-bisphosphate aldolase class II